MGELSHLDRDPELTFPIRRATDPGQNRCLARWICGPAVVKWRAKAFCHLLTLSRIALGRHRHSSYMHSQIVCSPPDCDWLERLQCKSLAAVVKQTAAISSPPLLTVWLKRAEEMSSASICLSVLLYVMLCLPASFSLCAVFVHIRTRNYVFCNHYFKLFSVHWMPLFWWSTWYKDYDSTWKHSVVSCSYFSRCTQTE